MTDPAEASGQRGPVDQALTGVPVVDDAMVHLVDLDEAPLAEHHERLQRAHAGLQGALDPDRPTPLG